MSTTILVAIAAVLGLILVLALAISVAKGGARCPLCGARLPRNAMTCPACTERRVVSPQPLPRAVEQTRASAFELVAVEGPLAQRHFAISNLGLTLGRHPDNDIVLANELMVSRHHAIITVEHGQAVLYDRDSANGTWVNEQRVFRHVLAPGDRIQMWQSRFVYAPTGEPLPTTPAGAPAAPTVHISGEWFAGYQLGPLIGKGGMSEVFKALDPSGRPVAIKILQQTDPYLVSKFVQEGNEIGPLLRDHPNIIYVHHFGQSSDNRLYIVMEYVDAPSLRKTIRGQWSEVDIVRVFGQVCSALAYAHQNNVVHRDIKPENILLTAEGSVKVLDFGIAKLTSAATVTHDKIVGTPEYISPEQARGEPVRPASDVYSLGIVLYEMLAGSVPFPRPQNQEAYGSAIEVIRRHLEEPPEPIRKRNPAATTPPHLERVAMRALKKDTRARYDTAKEMGLALGYTELERAVQPAPHHPAWSLVITQGARLGERIPLLEAGRAVGRADLDPGNTSISRHHVTFSFRGDRFWLQDLSKNGTWVDNARVYGEVPLQAGAMIAIGDCVLRLEAAPV